MPVGVYFHPESVTTKKYDEAIATLEAAGAGSAAGRVHHSCFGPADHVMVYEVWESAEAFAAFGETLMPILEKLGIDPGQPEIMPVHNLIQ